MTIMDYEQLQKYQQSLLDRALNEGIRRNEEQTKIWLDYKERHEKVIEGLETFREDLSVSCMVPIGKKALMRGKLTHTNEILVSLGDGYFAEYSAAQAIAMCNRRIKRSSDILASLEKEQKLFEMRREIPNCFDAFGGEERKEFVEHWDNEKLEDWRVEHRQREKEYRMKLAEMRNKEKPEIETEDDLFNKLDALELQEELEDELHRLEAARPDFYTEELDDGEVYDESESDEATDASDTPEHEIDSDNDDSTVKKVEFSLNARMQPRDSIPKVESLESTEESASQSIRLSFSDTSTNENSSNTFTLNATEVEGREKKVVFGEAQVKYFNGTDTIEVISQDFNAPTAGTSASSRLREVVNLDENADGKEEEIIRIEFKHSDYEPEVPNPENESIRSPRDIYREFLKPKSILKKSPLHVQRHEDIVPAVDYSTDEEVEDCPAGFSAYSTVVKEIREHVIETSVGTTLETVTQKRPVSKFKRDRANIKR